MDEQTEALALFAAMVADIERPRIASGHRLRNLEDRGLEDTEGYAVLQRLHNDLVTLETYVIDGQTIVDERTGKVMGWPGLRDMMEQHAFAPFLARHKGVGDKQFPRLLAAMVKHGYVNDHGVEIPDGDLLTWYDDDGNAHERTVASVWRYAGFDPEDGHARKRTKGEVAKWNPEVKMRARLIAESCLKSSCDKCRAMRRAEKQEIAEETGKRVRDVVLPWMPPPGNCTCAEDGYLYRAVYDRERAKWENRDTTDKHKHNHALRVAAKRLLKDILKEARRLREQEAIAA